MKKEKSFGNKDFKLYFGQAMTLVPSDEGIKVGVKQLLTASDVAQLRQTVVKYLAEEDRIPTHVYLDEVGVGDQGVGHVRLKKAVREQFRVIVTSVSSKKAYTPNGFGKPLCTGIGDKASSAFSKEPTQGHPGQKEMQKKVVETWTTGQWSQVPVDGQKEMQKKVVETWTTGQWSQVPVDGQKEMQKKVVETLAPILAEKGFKPKTSAMERVQIARFAYNTASTYLREAGYPVGSWSDMLNDSQNNDNAHPSESVFNLERILAGNGLINETPMHGMLGLDRTIDDGNGTISTANKLWVDVATALLCSGGRYSSEATKESAAFLKNSERLTVYSSGADVDKRLKTSLLYALDRYFDSSLRGYNVTVTVDGDYSTEKKLWKSTDAKNGFIVGDMDSDDPFYGPIRTILAVVPACGFYMSGYSFDTMVPPSSDCGEDAVPIKPKEDFGENLVLYVQGNSVTDLSPDSAQVLIQHLKDLFCDHGISGRTVTMQVEVGGTTTQQRKRLQEGTLAKLKQGGLLSALFLQDLEKIVIDDGYYIMDIQVHKQ